MLKRRLVRDVWVPILGSLLIILGGCAFLREFIFPPKVGATNPCVGTTCTQGATTYRNLCRMQGCSTAADFVDNLENNYINLDQAFAPTTVLQGHAHRGTNGDGPLLGLTSLNFTPLTGPVLSIDAGLATWDGPLANKLASPGGVSPGAQWTIPPTGATAGQLVGNTFGGSNSPAAINVNCSGPHTVTPYCATITQTSDVTGSPLSIGLYVLNNGSTGGGGAIGIEGIAAASGGGPQYGVYSGNNMYTVGTIQDADFGTSNGTADNAGDTIFYAKKGEWFQRGKNNSGGAQNDIKSVSGLLYALTGENDKSGSASALVVSTIATTKIPKIGTVYRITTGGFMEVSGNSTIEYLIKAGTGVLCDVTTGTIATGSPYQYSATFIITTKADGVSGQMACNGTFSYGTASGVAVVRAVNSAGSLDLSAAKTFTSVVVLPSAAAGNDIGESAFTLEQLGTCNGAC